MPQIIPAALVAPTQVSLSADAVGYLIRTIAGVEGSFVSNTGTAGAISKVASTGYFYATTGITAPDDGGVLEWYISNAGVKSTFLSAVAIEPAPNQADQAAGIRAALGLASANMDTQLSGISSKTTNLPSTFPVVDGSGRVTVGTNADKTGYSLTQAFPSNFSSLAITASTGQVTVGTNNDKTGYSLASSQTFSTTGSVGSVTGSVGSVTGAVGSVTGAVTVGIINNNVITANAIATDAFDADAIAASAVTELQANLATQASVDALPNAPAIADAVWDETLGTRANGTTGKKLADTSTLTTGDIPAGLTAQQNTRLTQLWQQAGFDSAVPVVRDKEGDVITETIGTTVITHTATNDGDTVITERQP